MLGQELLEPAEPGTRIVVKSELDLRLRAANPCRHIPIIDLDDLQVDLQCSLHPTLCAGDRRETAERRRVFGAGTHRVAKTLASRLELAASQRDATELHLWVGRKIELTHRRQISSGTRTASRPIPG